MSSLYPISLRHSLDLNRPFEMVVDWDSADDDTSLTAAHNEALEQFRAHLRSGAFASRLGYRPESTGVRHTSVSHRMQVQFDLYPAEPQSLRLLTRAIQYQHCIRESRAVIYFSGQPAEPAGPPEGVLTLTTAGKELTLLPLPFEAHSQWCYKLLNLEVIFGGAPPETVVQALDDCVARWCVFGNLGAYSSSEELDAFDADEEVELLVDLPAIGEDFISWSITQLNIPSQCVVPLFNMLRMVDPGGVWIREARIQ